MPSLDYLRSGADDEIDPRSDFAPGTPFARFLCGPQPSPTPIEDITRLSLADIRQDVVLTVIEARVRRGLPVANTCHVLIDTEIDLARATYRKARAEFYRQKRRQRRVARRTWVMTADEAADLADRIHALDVGEVTRRILRERRPGIPRKVMRQVVAAMVESTQVQPWEHHRRRRIVARIQTLSRKTGLPLDPKRLQAGGRV